MQCTYEVWCLRDPIPVKRGVQTTNGSGEVLSAVRTCAEKREESIAFCTSCEYVRTENFEGVPTCADTSAA